MHCCSRSGWQERSARRWCGAAYACPSKPRTTPRRFSGLNPPTHSKYPMDAERRESIARAQLNCNSWKANMKKTLFLQAPSYDGFDGGAGSRYQAKREIRSFWYPTWLAQPAALVPGSKLIDAPPARLRLADVLPLAGDYELAVLHTSTPSFAADVKVAEALKDANPRLKIGLS